MFKKLIGAMKPKGKSSSDLKDKNDKREEGSAKGNEADDADDKISTKSEFDWTRTQLSQAGSENVSESDGLIISPIMEAAQLASWGRIERAGSADTVGSKKTVSWKEDSSQMASQTPHGSGLTLRSTGALDGVSRTGSGDSSNALQKVEEEEEETADPQACLMRAVKRVKELHADIIRQADSTHDAYRLVHCFAVLRLYRKLHGPNAKTWPMRGRVPAGMSVAFYEDLSEHFSLADAKISIAQQSASIDMLLSRIGDLKTQLYPPLLSPGPPALPLAEDESVRGGLQLAISAGVMSKYGEYCRGVWGGEDEGVDEQEFSCFAFALAEVVSSQSVSSAPKLFAEAALKSEVWELLCKGGEGGMEERLQTEVAAKGAVMVLSCTIDRMEMHRARLEESLHSKVAYDALASGLSAVLVLSDTSLSPHDGGGEGNMSADERVRAGIEGDLNKGVGLDPAKGVGFHVGNITPQPGGGATVELTIPNPPPGVVLRLGAGGGGGGQGMAVRLFDELKSLVEAPESRVRQGVYTCKAMDVVVDWDADACVPDTVQKARGQGVLLPPLDIKQYPHQMPDAGIAHFIEVPNGCKPGSLLQVPRDMGMPNRGGSYVMVPIGGSGGSIILMGMQSGVLGIIGHIPAEYGRARTLVKEGKGATQEMFNLQEYDLASLKEMKRLEKESTHFLLRLSDERGGSDSTGNVGNMEEEEEEEEELGEEGDVLCHITLSSPPQAGLHDLAKDLAWAAGVKEEHITVLAVKNAGTRADVKIAKNCDPDGERSASRVAQDIKDQIGYDLSAIRRLNTTEKAVAFEIDKFCQKKKMKQQKPGMANAAKALGPQDRAVIKKLMQEAAIKDDYISELRAEGDAIEAELATCIEGLDEVWEALQEEQKRGHALEKTLRETLSLKRYKDELWAVKSRNIINEQNLTARVDNIHLVLSSISVIVTGATHGGMDDTPMMLESIRGMAMEEMSMPTIAAELPPDDPHKAMTGLGDWTYSPMPSLGPKVKRWKGLGGGGEEGVEQLREGLRKRDEGIAAVTSEVEQLGIQVDATIALRNQAMEALDQEKELNIKRVSYIEENGDHHEELDELHAAWAADADRLFGLEKRYHRGRKALSVIIKEAEKGGRNVDLRLMAAIQAGLKT